MTGAEIAFVMQLIQWGIKVAPDVEAFVVAAKKHIEQLFMGRLITVEQQAQMHAFLDDLNAARKAGVVDPAWTVEPDPQWR